MTDIIEEKASLQQVVADAVAAVGVEFVGCELLGGEDGGRILRVYIDADGGVNVEACQLVSRQIDMSMEVIEPPLITGHYQLEVSSPGVQRPLFTLEHYQRFVGQQIQVKLLPSGESKARRRYLGKLVAVEDQNIVVQCDEDETVSLPFAQIESGKLKVDWTELLKSAKRKKDK
jgi:ribosome maturation factor RimP